MELLPTASASWCLLSTSFWKLTICSVAIRFGLLAGQFSLELGAFGIAKHPAALFVHFVKHTIDAFKLLVAHFVPLADGPDGVFAAFRPRRPPRQS